MIGLYKRFDSLRVCKVDCVFEDTVLLLCGLIRVALILPRSCPNPYAVLLHQYLHRSCGGVF
jgi:hypothetical protein